MVFHHTESRRSQEDQAENWVKAGERVSKGVQRYQQNGAHAIHERGEIWIHFGMGERGKRKSRYHYRRVLLHETQAQWQHFQKLANW